jgi:hypothetical protein
MSTSVQIVLDRQADEDVRVFRALRMRSISIEANPLQQLRSRDYLTSVTEVNSGQQRHCPGAPARRERGREIPRIGSSVKRLRFMLWSRWGPQNELQTGLSPRQDQRT